MKTSSDGQAPPLIDRTRAWSCLVSNLLVLPGLGSVMAGWRKSGYAQIGLAIGGFALTVVALARFVFAWAREFILPTDPGLYLAAGIGIVVFLIGWCWSLLTSLAVFRETS